MNARVKVIQQVRDWGKCLGVRITASIAKAARFARGTPISVEVVEDGVLLRVVGRPRLTLEQKLKAFDPKLHGGESMVSGRTGAEVF